MGSLYFALEQSGLDKKLLTNYMSDYRIIFEEDQIIEVERLLRAAIPEEESLPEIQVPDSPVGNFSSESTPCSVMTNDTDN